MAKYNDFHYERYTSNGPSPGPGPNTPPPDPSQYQPRPASSNTGSSKKGDIFAWVFAFGLLFGLPPLGVALMVYLALNDKGRIRTLFNEGRNRVKQGVETAKEKAEDAKEAADKAKADKAEKTSGAKSPANAGGKLFTVLGWLLIAFAVFMLLSRVGAGMSLWALTTFICVALGGGAMLLKSALGRKKAKQFARCITVSGTEGVVSLSRLAETLGMKPEALEKQLEEMIDRGYYGEKSYIDHARSLLVIDPAAMRDVYRQEDEAKMSEAEQAAKAQQTEYERIIAEIRQADIDIEDEVMSEKIRRMQAITTAIFNEVEAHPEKRSQITRFMNYYLPTTLKLLKSYARIEAQGVTGENMAKAKADIEGIADTLVEGYEKQLDTLYRAEAMDIAGDVSVIEKMMKGENGESPFAPKNENRGQTLGGSGT